MAIWFCWRVAGLVAVAAGLLVASPGPALATAGGATVFVHSAKGGEVRGGRLILRGVGRQLTWVTNGGRSGAVSVARLHRRLFPRGTPAATGLLYIAGRRPGRAVALRLSRPGHSASRHRVSYRAIPLRQARGRGRVARASVPRRFGAASLSILGAPAVLGGTSGGHDCSAGLLNHTLYDLEAVSSSKSATDVWDPEIRPGTVSKALTGIAGWGSDGGPLLGCSNTTVWNFPNPRNRTLPQGQSPSPPPIPGPAHSATPARPPTRNTPAGRGLTTRGRSSGRSDRASKGLAGPSMRARVSFDEGRAFHGRVRRPLLLCAEGVALTGAVRGGVDDSGMEERP